PTSTLFPYTTLFRSTWHTPRSRKLRATAVTWGLAPGAAASERRQGGLSRWQSLRRRLPRREICFSSALDESFHRCRKVCWLAPQDRKSTRLNSSHVS